MAASKCNNILVRGVNWIGDAVMTMPALRSIKNADRKARVTLLVKPWVAPLFEKDPHVDAILLYGDEHKGIAGKYRLAQELRKYGFCMAVLFQNALDAAALAFLSAIPERIGYDRDGRGFLLTRAVPFNEYAARLHHIDYYLNLLSKAGLPVLDGEPWIYLSLEERTRAREFLRGLARPVIGINPGAAYGSSKRWRPERFAGVISRVLADLKGSAVIFGGPQETGIAEEILSHEGIIPGARILNLSGRTSVRELAALIAECDVMVTNDSGPMHIGYAVGTPLVAIFGSTSPDLTGPSQTEGIVIRKPVGCSPCFARECRKKDLQCMDLITADEVFAAVKALQPAKKAVFFDRDGTLCREAGYLSRMEDFFVFPEIAHLGRLREAGFTLIGVSNQSGIARGMVREDFVKTVNALFIGKYGFQDFYYCPHHPDEHCSCRKPEPGLLMRARQDHLVNLKESYVVGDKEADMLLAKSVGATGVLVTTGQEQTSGHADFIAKDLDEAVLFIEQRERGING